MRAAQGLRAAALAVVLAGVAAQAAPAQTALPPDFPSPRVPADNPPSAARIELGRHLFYDRRLSGNGTQSCATCHLQRLAFTDGRARAVGSTGGLTPRSSQGLANVAWHATYTWANPALVTLERQMEVPLFGDNPVEMGVNDGNRDAVLRRFAKDRAYQRRFQAAFAGEAQPVQWPHIIQAIAAFERTLVSGQSKYDAYLAGKAKLSAAETRGKDLFFGERAECFHCHGGFNFNDQVVHAASREVETPFHNTGLYNIDGRGGFPEPNRGVFEVSGDPEDMGRFRAPSLRNVALTAPYMHDGSIKSLREVVAFYARGGRKIDRGPLAGDGRESPLRSELVGAIDLSAQDQRDLVAFLRTLTDRQFVRDPRYAKPAGLR